MKLQDDLIYIKDNKAIPSPYAKTIIEFKNLKVEELGFVYFMCDHRSPFAVKFPDRHKPRSLKLETPVSAIVVQVRAHSARQSHWSEPFEPDRCCNE